MKYVLLCLLLLVMFLTVALVIVIQTGGKQREELPDQSAERSERDDTSLAELLMSTERRSNADRIIATRNNLIANLRQLMNDPKIDTKTKEQATRILKEYSVQDAKREPLPEEQPVAANKEESQKIMNVDRLLSPTEGWREESRVLQARKDLIKDLLAIIDDPKVRSDIKVSAVIILGEYRATEAAEKLSVSMRKIVPVEAGGRFRRPPAYKALCQIGKSATPFLIQNIIQSKDEMLRDYSAAILVEIEGKPFARTLLESAMKKANMTAAQQAEMWRRFPSSFR